MSGDYYTGPNPLLKGTLNSVERERLRERDREARVKMTYEAEQRVPQDVFDSGPLFGEIVRLNPKSNDKERQQIERKLGKYDEVKYLLDQDSTNLYGIDGQPPPSPAPSLAAGSHEFKKPNVCSQPQPHRSSHHNHHHHSSSQRGGFVKPADGKPAYAGRGFYPGQPMKHSSSSSNDFRTSGMVPVKGPPINNMLGQSSGSGSGSNNSGGSGGSNGSGGTTNHHSSSSSGRSSSSHEFSGKLHQSSRNLPKLHIEPRDASSLSANSNNPSATPSQANVENILVEMTSAVRTPLTAIAATPRKEMESKFTFNPVSGKMESLSPIKPPVADKSIRVNLLKDILAPVSRVPISTSVFKTGDLGNTLTPFSSPCSPSTTASSTSVSSKTKTTTASVSLSTTTTTTSSSKTASTNLTRLKSLVLSEDSEDDAGDEDEDDDNNEDSEEESKSQSKSTSNQQPVTKTDSISPAKLENTVKTEMSAKEERSSSSSGDSDSDSCSDSEDSSSDSLSQPSLPVPEQPDPGYSQRWNLTNFLPPSAHGSARLASQTQQISENGEKSKTDDSDSSGDTTQKSQIASSSSSESDGENMKSKTSKATRTTTANRVSASDDSSDEDDRNRRKYSARRSSSSSQSSEDSDHPTKTVNSGSGPSGSNNAGGAANANNNNNNSSVTVVGVVRPHQRKPPSPQVFNRSHISPQPNTEDRFGYMQQRASLQMSAPEPRCELPSHSESDGVMQSMNRNRLADSFQSQPTNAKVSTATKSSQKAVAATSAAPKSGKGRKPKSPALVSATDAAPKKKRGRKRTKVLEISDSEDEDKKVKVPERKRPGRPPIKRPDPNDVDWNAGSRRKVLDNKFSATNLWMERERRTTLRNSFTAPDSESDELAAPPKPTARVIPAVKKKESARATRDSSCESIRNDGDYGIMSTAGGKNNVTKAEESPPKLDVEGIAVQDKKKSDTLRKLFSRPGESGGKGGGKGKGGKGKSGVIVMESETERKMLQRSLSPTASLHHVDRMPNIPRAVEMGCSLSQTMDDHVTDISRINDRVPNLSRATDSRSAISRQDRVPEIASNVPSTPSASVELPKLTYNENGRPSLMCKIDLSKIPRTLVKKRSEEMRIRSDLPDTRQNVDLQATPPTLDIVNLPMIEPILSNDEEDSVVIESSRSAKRHSTKKQKSAKRKHHMKEEPPPPPPQIFKSTAHTPSVDPESDSMSSDSEPRKKLKTRMLMRPADTMHNLMNPCYQLTVSANNLCLDRGSDDESWRSDVSSCISCSSSPLPLRTDMYGGHVKRSSKHHHPSRVCSKRRTDLSQRHPSLNDPAPPLMHISSTNYDRTIPDPSLNAYQMNIAEIVRPIVPTHHGIYYSYLEHKVSEEINSESDNVSPNVYLTEAKRLKYAADTERDKVAQGMQYLEAILSFVLTGHVLERKNQMETAFSMYSETLKLIVYISNKFRQICTSTAQSNIPNKIAILSLRCESILNLKLYTMQESEVRSVHNTVTEYFSKPISIETCLVANQSTPSPHSPTPSPASSVGSSSGYSSGDRRTSGVAQCIAVPVDCHKALQKQHSLYSNLIASFNYWEEADRLIFSGGNKDFFIELDRFCGPLTLHSSLKDLVHYVRVGIQRLKGIISHHQRV